MKTHFKFTTAKNSKKYVINIELEFLKNKTRHFAFRTEKQVEEFFKEAINREIVKNLKDNGPSLILFKYKNRELSLLVDIFCNPVKKTTTIIKIKYLLNRHNEMFNKISNICPSQNIADMDDYKIPTRIIAREFIDVYLDTFTIEKVKVNTFLSYFVYANKREILSEYDVNNILQKIAGVFFSGNSNIVNLESVLDKEPFWIWIKEEAPVDEDNFYIKDEKDSFLCCLSLAKKVKNKKAFYELLLDQIYKNPTKQKIEHIKENKEKIFEEPVYIQKKEVKIKKSRKVSRRGLKIVKKGEQK